ncbi:MAG: hypothetical protein MJZ89_04320 [Paludibacteraceae bacterium]|nr:hypothetical protein [Paludibacteraceae bacterium]
MVFALGLTTVQAQTHYRAWADKNGWFHLSWVNLGLSVANVMGQKSNVQLPTNLNRNGDLRSLELAPELSLFRLRLSVVDINWLSVGGSFEKMPTDQKKSGFDVRNFYWKPTLLFHIPMNANSSFAFGGGAKIYFQNEKANVQEIAAGRQVVNIFNKPTYIDPRIQVGFHFILTSRFAVDLYGHYTTEYWGITDQGKLNLQNHIIGGEFDLVF